MMGMVALKQQCYSYRDKMTIAMTMSKMTILLRQQWCLQNSNPLEMIAKQRQVKAMTMKQQCYGDNDGQLQNDNCNQQQWQLRNDMINLNG